MKKTMIVGILAILTAMAAPANAQYQYYENFENGLTGWSLWTERGTNQSGPSDEVPILGNQPPWSGPNELMAYVGGDGFNGGIYQVINLPLGAGNYMVDGFWRSSNVTAQNAWAEVIIVEGNNPPTDGVDLQGPLIYKNDTFGGGPTWDGQISTDPNNNQGAAPGTGMFATASGTITLVLKTGNGSGASGSYFDDVSITPEPASLAMLGLGAAPLFLRRRRRA